MTSKPPITTLIIGAGPAGLAVAGRLAHLGQPFVLLEASGQVGMAWRQHYDRLHLHTVKTYSALPHLPTRPTTQRTYPAASLLSIWGTMPLILVFSRFLIRR